MKITVNGKTLEGEGCVRSRKRVGSWLTPTSVAFYIEKGSDDEKVLTQAFDSGRSPVIYINDLKFDSVIVNRGAEGCYVEFRLDVTGDTE